MYFLAFFAIYFLIFYPFEKKRLFKKQIQKLEKNNLNEVNITLTEDEFIMVTSSEKLNLSWSVIKQGNITNKGISLIYSTNKYWIPNLFIDKPNRQENINDFIESKVEKIIKPKSYDSFWRKG